ncbi:PPE domain-containing protein [Actinosynnema sp. NPDC020468]|uniref:PPE domain-containing protein n=1 Tax=Actinosynnema sp. NPDC020468 TaxID=3154488 RepID=UPI0033C41D99
MGDHRWRGYAHPELHRMINEGPGVAASRPLEDGWKALSESLGQIDTEIQEGLAKLGASWEGSTADTTLAALSPLAQWAADAQQGSDVMKTSAQLQGEYIVEARKQMPEPVPVTTEAPSTADKVLGLLGGPAGMLHVIKQQNDHEQQEAAQDNAEAKAVEVMENYQSSSEWNRDTLGEFVPPPKVVIDTPPPAGSGEYNSSSANYRSTPTWTEPSDGGGTTNTSWTPPPSGPTVTPTYTPPANNTGTTHTVWAPPTPTPPPVAPVPNPTPNPTPPPVTAKPPIGTIPPVWTQIGGQPGGGPAGGGGKTGVPGRPTVPNGPSGRMSGGLDVPGSRGGAPGQSGPGGRGGLGGLPGGGLSGLGETTGSGAQGRGGMSGVGAFGANAPGAAGPGGASGRGGAGMAGGGGAGGHAGEGEEDVEHKSADFLVETADVFGDERRVAPSVIGEAPQ